MPKHSEQYRDSLLSDITDPEYQMYKSSFEENMNDHEKLKTLASNIEQKAREKLEKGLYSQAGYFFLLLEEVEEKLGAISQTIAFARERAGDSFARAKEWGMAGVLYRGVVYQLRRHGEFDDEILLQYWKLKAAERNYLRQSRRWGRWLIYSLWQVTTDYGVSFKKLLESVFAVFLIWGHFFALGTWLTDGKFIQGHNGPAYLDHFYFSIVVFSSLGFGDYWPVHPFAKLLVVVEVLLGLIFLGLLIAIISRHIMLIGTIDLSYRRRFKESRKLMRY